MLEKMLDSEASLMDMTVDYPASGEVASCDAIDVVVFVRRRRVVNLSKT
jgi:hypothetical protein